LIQTHSHVKGTKQEEDANTIEPPHFSLLRRKLEVLARSGRVEGLATKADRNAGAKKVIEGGGDTLEDLTVVIVSLN